VVLAHPFLFALLLAVLEPVAGICTVIGLASRLAAGVGLGLSLAFFSPRAGRSGRSSTAPTCRLPPAG